MTPNDRAARGIRTKLLLDSDDVKQALADIEADIIAEWRKCLFTRSRERKWNELKGLQRLRDRLSSYANQAPR